jgi:hypothetical protein
LPLDSPLINSGELRPASPQLLREIRLLAGGCVPFIDGGGRTNFAHCREPTCLHFGASWRKQAEGKARDRQKALEAQGLRPVVTRIEIADGLTEQQVFSDLTTAQGAD